MSIVISSESNVITIGDVVIDVQGMEIETELQMAEDTLIIDCSLEAEGGESKNNDANVSSFNSRL